MLYYATIAIILLTINIYCLVKARNMLNGSTSILYIAVVFGSAMYAFTDPYFLSKIRATLDYNVIHLIFADPTFAFDYVMDILVSIGNDTWLLLPLTISMYVFSRLLNKDTENV